MDILSLVEELEEMVSDASAIPFSSRVMIDKDDILDLIKRINAAVPEEIRRAKWIKEEKDHILLEAKKEAEAILTSAQEEESRLLEHARYEENRVIEEARSLADDLISSHKITSLSEAYGKDLVADAYRKAEEIKTGAYSYSDNMLASLEIKIQKCLETITINRDELKDFVEKE